MLGKTSVIGMTLIEVLIVIAILGALISIAIPNYQQQQLQSYRQVALSDLMKIQFELERQYDGQYHPELIVNDGECFICHSDPLRFSFTITLNNELNNESNQQPTYSIQATALTTKNQHLDSCFSSNNQNQVYLQLSANHQTSPTGCWP